MRSHPMREGLYRIVYRTPLGSGAGVVMLEAGRLRGGDAYRFYVGDYTIEAGAFSADLRIERHATGDENRSVFGREGVALHLEGAGLGDEAVLRGTTPQAPRVVIDAVLTRLTD